MQQQIAQVKDRRPQLAQAADRIDALGNGSLESKCRITHRDIQSPVRRPPRRPHALPGRRIDVGVLQHLLGIIPIAENQNGRQPQRPRTRSAPDRRPRAMLGQEGAVGGESMGVMSLRFPEVSVCHASGLRWGLGNRGETILRVLHSFLQFCHDLAGKVRDFYRNMVQRKFNLGDIAVLLRLPLVAASPLRDNSPLASSSSRTTHSRSASRRRPS